ncbi:hypothetical protein Tco_0873425 [Tanacetum coccineum]|uniref:Uncharacterized protein n=1 Tax=Tanacetum coccineum TaxID=301880 RepID=A0ABQ5BKF6_9ASTR
MLGNILVYLRNDVVTEGVTLEVCLVTEGATLEACLVTKDITMDDYLVAKQSTVDSSTSSEQQNKCNSLRNECSRSRKENKSSDNQSSSLGNDAYADIGPLYDSDTVYEVYHDMFENMFVYGIQNLEQPESIPDTYMVNENNSNIISNIPNIDADKNKEEHDYVDDEEKGKYDQYVQPLLKRKNELEKKNQEFLKQINDLDNKLRKAGQTDQTLRMLLPKEDNVQTEKQGRGFENKNDVENPSLLNKAKELAPSLYNIDEIGQDFLSDHKINSEEKLKCKAEKHLKYEKDFAKLEAHFTFLELKSQKQSLTSVQYGHVLSDKSDEAKIKFDTEDLGTINIE